MNYTRHTHIYCGLFLIRGWCLVRSRCWLMKVVVWVQLSFQCYLVRIPLITLFIGRGKRFLALIDHDRLANYVDALNGFIIHSVFAIVSQPLLKRVLKIILQLPATSIVFPYLSGNKVIMNEILVIRLLNQLLFGQYRIVLLHWRALVNLCPTQLLRVSDWELMKLRSVLFLANFYPDLPGNYNIHLRCILLTALFRNLLDSWRPFPLFYGRRIKCRIATSWGRKGVLNYF